MTHLRSSLAGKIPKEPMTSEEAEYELYHKKNAVVVYLDDEENDFIREYHQLRAEKRFGKRKRK